MPVTRNADGSWLLVSDTDPTDIATVQAGATDEEVCEAVDAFFNGKTWLASSMSTIKSWFMGGTSVKG